MCVNNTNGNCRRVSTIVSHVQCTQLQGKTLLPPVRKSDENKMCLVIDLDETLVHSSFKPITNPDFIVPVEIDGTIHLVYVLKRPWVDEFLAHVGELYECVLFTASLAKYADPVADILDTKGVFRSRLFRESCVLYRGNYVKDLSRLGRDLHRVIIVDNSPVCVRACHALFQSLLLMSPLSPLCRLHIHFILTTQCQLLHGSTICLTLNFMTWSLFSTNFHVLMTFTLFYEVKILLLLVHLKVKININVQELIVVVIEQVVICLWCT